VLGLRSAEQPIDIHTFEIATVDVVAATYDSYGQSTSLRSGCR
jgi:hypothetical protein